MKGRSFRAFSLGRYLTWPSPSSQLSTHPRSSSLLTIPLTLSLLWLEGRRLSRE